MNLALDFELSKEDNLLKRFEEIHNYIYANDGLSTQQTLEEIIKILFIKIYDENHKTREFQISADELNHLKNSNTSTAFVKRITGLLEETKKDFKDVFDTDDKIRLSNNALGYTVNKLQSISLGDSSNDAKGLAFQKFLAHQEKDGRGQFFTPEPVIDFCVEIIQPKIYETIIDPACGSGGFLISSLKHLQRNNLTAKASNIVSKNIFGLDINKNIARIAKMKLLLEANGQANIFCTNSLEDLDEVKLIATGALNKKSFDGFDVVLTNPPFGTVGKITNAKTLSQYDLGYKWTGSANEYYKTKILRDGQSAEILFIERCLQLLNEGGRLGIVLPNGHFENPSLEYLRFYLKQKANVLAIVNLPQETFIPYGTGVKTSLLFLEKETANTKTVYPIFFSKIKKPGYQGNKNGTPIYKKDKYGMTLKDKSGKQILDEDFSIVVEEYKAFQETQKVNSDNSFSLNFNELNGRFDYDFYSPENRKMILGLEDKNAKRLCEVAEIVKIKSKKLNQSDKTVKYVELSDINTHSFEIINTEDYAVHELPSRASYELKTGDIITAVAGNSVGTQKHATALVTEEFEGCICTNGFRVLRNFKIDPYYLLYFLKSDAFLNQTFMYRTGAAIPNISDADLANILIHIPSDKVMKQISAKMKKAFELRQESRKQIESINLELQT
jgi:type I restriction enzyme M protein